MSIQIKLKNSVVQDSTPSTSDLPAVGEIALNANINSIGGFMRASNNTIVKIFGPGSLTTPTATTTVSGISELATNAETTTGTATNRVVTPAGLNAVTVAERTTSNTNYVAKAGSTLTGVLTMPNGSNSAPAINFGDSDSGIFGGTNTVSLAAGGITRLTADTGVSVVGTLAVTGAITSTSDLTIADKIIHSGDANTSIRFPSSDTISFETSATEKFRVDSGGHISIGTSTSRSIGGSVERKLQIEATDGSAGISITRNGSANTPAFLSFGKQRSGAVGGNTIVQDNDQLGQIHFAGADGTDIASIAANISAFVDGTPGSNDMPGRLEFKTTADGAASPTTRLTIDSAGLVKLPDNGKFVAGAGSDLQIYHDGSNSYIKDDGAGAVILQTNKLEIKNTAAGEDLAKFTQNAAVELYYDNSLKLETKSDGIDVTGEVQCDSLDVDGGFNIDGSQITYDPSSNIMKFTDNAQLRFGSGNDLRIYHDGTDNIIQAAANDLNILMVSSENAIVAKQNGAVELYYDNSKKLETTSDGSLTAGRHTIQGHSNIDNQGSPLLFLQDSTNTAIKAVFLLEDDYTTGRAALAINVGEAGVTNDRDLMLQKAGGRVGIRCTPTTSFEVSGTSKFNGSITGNDNIKIKLGTGEDLQLYHDGSNSRIVDSGTGNLILQSNRIALNNPDSSENMVTADENGAVSLYYDNSKKFETTSTGGQFLGKLHFNDGSALSGANKVVFGDGEDLQIYHDGSNSLVHNNTGSVIIENDASNANSIFIKAKSGEHSIIANHNGGVELYHDNSVKFQTTSTGVSLANGADTTTSKLTLALGNASQKIATIQGTSTSTNEKGIAFKTFSFNAVDALTLTPAGFVGINETSPEGRLHISSGTSGDCQLIIEADTDNNDENDNPRILFRQDGGADQSSIGQGNNTLILANSVPNGGIEFKTGDTSPYTNATTRMFIDTQGDVGINIANPTQKLHIDGNILLTNSKNLYFGDTGTKIDGVAGGDITFMTGSAIRMRIDNSGRFKINTSSSFGPKLIVNQAGSNTLKTSGNMTNGFFLGMAGTGSAAFNMGTDGEDTNFNSAFANNAGVARGYKFRTGGTVRLTIATNGQVSGDLNDTSDEKLKKNIVSIADGVINKIKQLRPVNFDWKEEEEDSKGHSGFIAQEIKTIIPDLVGGTEYDENTKSSGYSVNTYGLVAYLTKALQETISKVEILENKVSTLEGA